jgi:hypothetical protein
MAAGLKQLGEKARRSVESMKCKMAGAEARFVLRTLLARLEALPLLQSAFN